MTSIGGLYGEMAGALDALVDAQRRKLQACFLARRPFKRVGTGLDEVWFYPTLFNGTIPLDIRSPTDGPTGGEQYRSTPTPTNRGR